jgi:hypothetical protein
MKGNINTMSITSNILIPLVLGLVCASIVYATQAGKTLPLISGPRAALIALLVIGMAACFFGGIGQVGVSGRWASPLAILGYLLGAAILIVMIAAFAGWKLPWVHSETQAVTAVAILMAIKFLIGIPSYIFHWL